MGQSQGPALALSRAPPNKAICAGISPALKLPVVPQWFRIKIQTLTNAPKGLHALGAAWSPGPSMVMIMLLSSSSFHGHVPLFLLLNDSTCNILPHNHMSVLFPKPGGSLPCSRSHLPSPLQVWAFSGRPQSCVGSICHHTHPRALITLVISFSAGSVMCIMAECCKPQHRTAHEGWENLVLC